MTDADQPDTSVRLRNCVLSKSSCSTCAGLTENAIYRLCPLQHVVCLRKRPLLVPANSDGRDMACVVQRS